MEAAFGLSVTITMLMTTVLLNFYLLFIKKTNRLLVMVIIGLFLVIETSFLVANLQKFMHGGYVTLLLGLFLFWIMFTWQWAGKIKQSLRRFVSINKHVPVLNTLSNDKEIPKYATHLVYISNAKMGDKVEEDIVRSVYYNQPKRADLYWLLHIEVTDEPFTREYEVEVIERNEVMRITYWLGFRVIPHINVLFKEVLDELYNNREFETSDTWKIFYQHNPMGDYRFVVLENYLSEDNELPLWKKIPLRIYFVLKRIEIDTAEAYNLDESLVIKEKVPLVVAQPNPVKLKRIYSAKHEQRGR
jgi:KUP system potassium uptake protein